MPGKLPRDVLKLPTQLGQSRVCELEAASPYRSYLHGKDAQVYMLNMGGLGDLQVCDTTVPKASDRDFLIPR